MRPRARKSIADRFWPKVQKTETCWLWTGAKNDAGYGKLWDYEYGAPRAAHRLAWEMEHGAIPDGLFLCHHCDTPTCVRPDHMFVGTQFDNMRDAARKGRVGVPRRADCKRGHPLTPENSVTKTGRNGAEIRTCRECKREYEMRVYFRKNPNGKPRGRSLKARMLTEENRRAS